MATFFDRIKALGKSNKTDTPPSTPTTTEGGASPTPPESGADNTNTGSTEPQVTQTTVHVPNDFTTSVFSFRERGFTNGALGVNPQPFADYTVSFNTFQYLEEKVERLRNKVTRLKGLLTTAINERKLFVDTLQPLVQKIGELDIKIKFEEDEVERRKKAIEDRTESVHGITTDKSWLYIFILIFAATSFILADFSVSLSVVANALNLGESNVESIMLALGICALSILIKPAYDRLVEEKYLSGQVRMFTVTIRAVLIFTAIFMIIAGLFRFEGFKYKQQEELKEENQSTPKTGIVQPRSTVLSGPTTFIPDTLGADTILAPKPEASAADIYIKLLNDNALLVKLFFIVSGILFAVGGAICLGIVIPLLRNKRLLYLARRDNKKDIDENSKSYKMIAEYTQQRVAPASQKELAEKRYELSDDIITLRKQLIEAEIELEQAIKDLFLAKITRNKHEYQDGYERGLRIAELGGEAWVEDHFRQMYGETTVYDDAGNPIATVNTNGSGEGAKEGMKTGGVYSRTRPFVALRKIILNKYRDSISGKSTYSAHPIDFNVDSN